MIERERRQVGPEVGPTSAFYSCSPTGMHGPPYIFWANRTPFSLCVRRYTQAVVALTACFSIAFFAIPASMLTWGFEAEAERLFKKAGLDEGLLQFSLYNSWFYGEFLC